MNELQIFDYKGKNVRTVEIDGEPWFNLKDVCTILGISDNRTVAARLDGDELTRVKTASGGQMREMVFVNESGLYNVILRSDKPEAKPFRKHVTSVILPTIRKTGGYVADEDKFADIYLHGVANEYKELFKTNLKTIKYLNGEVQRLTGEVDDLTNNVNCLTEEATAKDEVIAQQTAEIEQAKPKVEFYDTVANTKELLSVSQYCKEIYDTDKIKIGRNRMYKWLRDQKYLRYNNEPYQQYVDAGYFVVKQVWVKINGTPEPKPQTFLTGKGQQYILNKLKEFVKPTQVATL